MRKIIISMILVLMSTPAFAVITLTNGSWSTTFNCPDWQQDISTTSHYGTATEICDGLINENYNNTCDGFVSVTNSDGNMAAGGGGKGFRQRICAGSMQQSGSPSIIMNPYPSEVWSRFYIRYPVGFSWDFHGHKMVYLTAPPNGNSPNGYISWADPAVLRFYDQEHGVTYYANDGFTWKNMVGGTTGDGLWHSVEFHFKTDTNGSDGEVDIWVDGVRHVHYTNVNLSGRGIGKWGMVINQDNITQGGWLDVDDIAVSTVGYIGPLTVGGGGIMMPKPPGSLIIK